MKKTPPDVTALMRRCIELWPDITLTRLCPADPSTMKFGRFAWHAFVTDFRPKKPDRLQFKARTLPAVLGKVIEAGKQVRRAAKARATK